jgi:major histocompatibility complex class I
MHTNTSLKNKYFLIKRRKTHRYKGATQKKITSRKGSWAVVVHTFNPSTWEAEAGGFLSLRPAWSTE